MDAMTTIRTVMPKVLRVFFPQFLACVIAAPALAQSQFPPDADIRAAFHRVKVPSGNVGVVIGLLEADRSRRVLTIGNQAYDSSTLFEIGSITKVFTGILLGEMHERGEVKLNQPVRELLPEGVTVPSRNGREITLVDLATHSSGLPRMPDNFQPADWSNPYVDYTVAQLYDFLRRYQLPRDIGAISEYSNLGVGLLGHALSLRADTSYGALVRMRILDPLGMSSTVIAIPDSLKPRLAPGHDAAGNRVNNWDVHTLAGAGALRSSAHDLLTFLEANLSPPQGSTLGRAIRRSHVIHFRRSPTSGSGLGWGVSTSRFGRPILAHDGGTAGYRSFAAYDPERRIGVVVLSNQSIDVTRIGLHMLDARTPITTSGLARAFSIIALVLAGLLVTGVFFASLCDTTIARSACPSSNNLAPGNVDDTALFQFPD